MMVSKRHRNNRLELEIFESFHSDHQMYDENINSVSSGFTEDHIVELDVELEKLKDSKRKSKNRAITAQQTINRLRKEIIVYPQGSYMTASRRYVSRRAVSV